MSQPSSKDAATRPPRGMRDFLPDQVRKRQYAIGIIRRVYESCGFEPLETPALENLSVLLGKYGEEGDQLLFKVLRRGDKLRHAIKDRGESIPVTELADLGLRYDLTVPLARVVAEHQGQLPAVWKRYQIQPVWRADRPSKGRFREFYQCDVDILGSSSPMVEAEILAAGCQALIELKFDSFVLRLNHRQVLFALMEEAGIPGPLQMDTVVAIDKMDKVGLEGVCRELVERGIEQSNVDRLIPLLSFTDDDPAEVLRHLRAACSREDAQKALDNLEKIIRLLATGPAAGRIRLDPYLARGLTYYTGAIFEMSSEDLGGSLAGGGRYDKLVGMFSGKEIPACGLSLGLERLLAIMEEKNFFSEAMIPAQVMVTCFNEELMPSSLETAWKLRRAGFRADVHPEPQKLGKQLKVAQKKGVLLVVIQGPEEAAAGQVTMKDLRSGQQQTIDAAVLVDAVQKLLS